MPPSVCQRLAAVWASRTADRDHGPQTTLVYGPESPSAVVVVLHDLFRVNRGESAASVQRWHGNPCCFDAFLVSHGG